MPKFEAGDIIRAKDLHESSIRNFGKDFFNIIVVSVLDYKYELKWEDQDKTKFMDTSFIYIDKEHDYVPEYQFKKEMQEIIAQGIDETNS